MATLKLDIEYDFDFDLIGVSSPIRGFNFAWALGRALGTDFEKEKNIALDFRKKDSFEVHNYKYQKDFSTMRIFENKAEVKAEEAVAVPSDLFGGQKEAAPDFFVPELKQFEFLVQVQGVIRSLTVNEILNKIRNIKQVQLANHINLDNIKSKQNLIFE